MSTPIESIVRPFADRNVFPTPFTKPGEQGSELVRIPIGFQGSIKSMGYSMSVNVSYFMGQVHQEEVAERDAAIQALQKAAKSQ